MNSRSNNSYFTLIKDFLKFDILVSCPFCWCKAIVKTGKYDFKTVDQDKIRFVCSTCGHNKKLIEKPDVVFLKTEKRTYSGKVYQIGSSVDPFFHFPVWLQTPFQGNILWAYNTEHLIFIEKHIDAKLRERNGKKFANESLGSRLPRWMTSAKNRNSILKKIDLLKVKTQIR